MGVGGAPNSAMLNVSADRERPEATRYLARIAAATTTGGQRLLEKSSGIVPLDRCGMKELQLAWPGKKRELLSHGKRRGNQGQTVCRGVYMEKAVEGVDVMESFVVEPTVEYL